MPYNDSPTISPSSDGNVQQELTEPAGMQNKLNQKHT
jgi:hypothetical protein